MIASSSAADLAIVAILRGVQPAQVIAVAEAIYAAGIRVLEVPLNSPDPFTSIARLAAHGGPAGNVVGAGTVLSVDEVRLVHASGGRLIVAPNCDVDVIREALRLGLTVMPGVATTTEMFAAIRAGATQLKLFPAVTLGPRHLKALAAVLPAGVQVFAVGGVEAADIHDWLAAGAAGFGFGSELFRPGYSLEDIERRARHVMRAFHDAQARLASANPGSNKTAVITGGSP